MRAVWLQVLLPALLHRAHRDALPEVHGVKQRETPAVLTLNPLFSIPPRERPWLWRAPAQLANAQGVAQNTPGALHHAQPLQRPCCWCATPFSPTAAWSRPQPQCCALLVLQPTQCPGDVGATLLFAAAAVCCCNATRAATWCPRAAAAAVVAGAAGAASSSCGRSRSSSSSSGHSIQTCGCPGSVCTWLRAQCSIPLHTVRLAQLLAGWLAVPRRCTSPHVACVQCFPGCSSTTPCHAVGNTWRDPSSVGQMSVEDLSVWLCVHLPPAEALLRSGLLVSWQSLILDQSCVWPDVAAQHLEWRPTGRHRVLLCCTPWHEQHMCAVTLFTNTPALIDTKTSSIAAA